MSISVETIVAQAREWIGVPYLHQGRSRVGCDCLGFIATMLNELGVDLALRNLPLNYGADPQELLVATLSRLCRNIALQPGALVAIKFPHGKFASHAAIYTGDSMIHCYRNVGKVVEHGYRGAWPRLAESIWAMPYVKYSRE